MTEVRAHARKGTRGVRSHVRIVSGPFAPDGSQGYDIYRGDLFVGSFSLLDIGDALVLNDFDIRAPYRGAGFGTATLRQVERLARKAGKRRIELEHVGPNAGRLYAREGYGSDSHPDRYQRGDFSEGGGFGAHPNPDNWSKRLR